MTLSPSISFKLLLPCVLVALTTACGMLLANPALASSHINGASQCHDFAQLPVALGPNQPTQYTIYGQLCNPPGGPSKVVEVLVSGASYDHYYWDWPNTPKGPAWSDQYSAVHALNGRGYSTFNIDRIGIGPPPTIPGGPTLTGGSSQPPSNLVDVISGAYVVHTLVQGLKNGSVNGTSLGVSFNKVILVGHSLGSIIATEEVASYNDVDGVILTGYAHAHPASPPLQPVQASTDPGAKGRFASLDAGYLTTADGTRGTGFYYAPASDPNVIAFDEEIKQTFTSAELNQAFTIGGADPSLTLQFTIPVLELVGQKDVLVCSGLNNGTGGSNCSSTQAFAQQEAPFFPHAQLQAQIIPATGHDLNLHYTAQSTYAIMAAWSAKIV